MHPLRSKIIEIAAKEIGTPSKWRIQDYQRSAIGRAVTRRVEWCGLFCLWALHEAGVACSVLWRIGGGFAEEQHLSRTRKPEPGDIAYFHHPYQHHALVESCDNGVLVTIDGNQTHDSVKRVTRSAGSATAFYSIQKLLDKFESQPETQDGPEK